MNERLDRMVYPRNPQFRRPRELIAIAVIGILFLIPIGQLGSLLFLEHQSGISIARLELSGAEFNASLRGLHKKLLRHRGLRNLYALGERGAEGQIAEASAAIDAEFLALASLRRRHAAELHVAAPMEQLRVAWANLEKDAPTLDAATSNRRHDEVLLLLRQLIERVAAKSSLLLDPDADINNLSRVMTFNLPAIGMELADLRGFGVEALLAPGIGANHRAKALDELGQVRENLDAIEMSLVTAFNANRPVERQLGVKHVKLADEVRRVLDTARELLQPATPARLSALQWFAQVGDTIEALNAFGDEMSSVRRALIESRIDRLVTSRNQSLIIALVCVLAAFAGLAFVGRGLLAAALWREKALAEAQEARAEAAAARAQAEQAAAAKADLLAVISDEMRIPLTATTGFADLLHGSALNQEQRQWAKYLLDNSLALRTLVDNILDFSRIEAGKLSIEKIPYSPVALIQECRDAFDESARSKGLLFDAISKALPEALEGDPLRIRQVLFSLLSNAIRFTARGLVRLSATTNAGRIRFEVRDTGAGIDAGRCAKLFDGAYQMDGATRRGYGGTGMSLQIAHRLVELMGGTMGMESALDEGSTFWFELPAVAASTVAEAAIPDQPSIAPPAQPATVAPEGPLALLVVDDTAAILDLARIIIEAMGHTVVTAVNGRQAVEAGTSRAFDLILMDLHMPILDGIEATRQLRAAGPNRTTPILAMTAAVYFQDKERCFEAGMSGTLVKPFRPEELRETIAKWVSAEAPSASPVSDSDQSLQIAGGAPPGRPESTGK